MRQQLRPTRLLLLGALFAVILRGASAQSETDAAALARAHAHNDYEHARPLLDALDRGFSSVEVDVWLADGRLLVAHDREAIRSDRTLESLYLDPLRDRVRQHGGRVQPNGPEFLLWIDVKSEAEATYAVLGSTLTAYADMVTTFSADGVLPKGVRVIVSGNRARDTMAREPVRFAAIDGRLLDLDSQASSALIPFVSDNWQLQFQWRGVGPFPPEERAKLIGLVSRAHEQRRKIRFWAIPDQREGWQECLDAGVDLINTDDLEGLRQFLLGNPARSIRVLLP